MAESLVAGRCEAKFLAATFPSLLDELLVCAIDRGLRLSFLGDRAA
jgi:hypothetical protein